MILKYIKLSIKILKFLFEMNDQIINNVETNNYLKILILK